MTDLLVSGAVAARHNQNRWVVDCTTCSSAMGVPRLCAVGEELLGWVVAFQVGDPMVRCWDCQSMIGPIVWPRDPAGIEAILSYRPDPVTRNWEPHESLEELLAENAAHGCIPPQWREMSEAAGGQLVLMDVLDGFVTGGVVMERRALLAGGRPQHEIGA